MRALCLALTLVLALLVPRPSIADYKITLYPDGTDSIGIPTGPYRGTCFLRCERVLGQTVRCDVAQRIATALVPIDCATHCSYAEANADTYMPEGVWWAPLPRNGAGFRHATTSWCPLLRRLDTQALVYPACHSENYQMMSLGQFGPADNECFFPDLPDGVPFEYVFPKVAP